MSGEDLHDESDRSDADSQDASEDDQQTPSTTTPRRKKQHKTSKPRLSTHQKNTNHKDAENKRRGAIRERFTDLSQMVPGTQGQERSEQVMLTKTAEFLKQLLREQRQLEAMADARGILVNDKYRLTDSDYGGGQWKQPHMGEYQKQKASKTSNSSKAASENDGK